MELCEFIAYAEQASDIADVLQSSIDIPVFKMSELTKYYKQLLTGIISEIDGTRPLEVPEVHTTRLRNHLEFDLLLLESRKSDREYLCSPKSNVGFSGSFSTNDQARSVSPLFVLLVNMIWYGQSVPE